MAYFDPPHKKLVDGIGDVLREAEGFMAGDLNTGASALQELELRLHGTNLTDFYELPPGAREEAIARMNELAKSSGLEPALLQDFPSKGGVEAEPPIAERMADRAASMALDKKQPKYWGVPKVLGERMLNDFWPSANDPEVPPQERMEGQV